MAIGKSIEIKIAATGGDAAASEIRKVEDATESAGKSTGGFTAKSNLMGAAAIGAAAGGKILGEQLGRIREALESIDIENLRKLSPEMAAQAEEMQRISEWFTDPLSAIQRAISGTTIAEAFAEMNAQIGQAAADHKANVDRIITDSTEQAAALKALTNEIAAANKILDAKDEADSAARDRADAEAIRNGAAPEDVKARRAKDDAEKEIERINRSLDPSIAGVNEAYRIAGQTKSTAQSLERDPQATKEQITKAREAAAAAQEELQKRQRELDNQKAIAEQQRRGVRETAAGTVENLEFEKARRLEQEQKKQDDQRRREQERQQQQSDRQREARTDRESKIGRDALGLLPKDVTREFAAAVESVTQSLQDGDQGGEMQKLIELLEILRAAIASGKGGDSKMLRRISILEQQIKNMRKPGQ